MSNTYLPTLENQEQAITISASTGRIDTHDIDEYSQTTPPWDVVLRQASFGQFQGTTEFVQIGGMLMYRELWTRRVLVNGGSPAGFYVVGGPISPKTDIHWCGSSLDRQRQAFGRPGGEVDFVIPEGGRHVVLLIPSGLLMSILDEETRTELASDARHHLVDSGALGATFLGVMDTLISKYLARPELLNNALECRALEQWLMEFVVRCIFARNSQRIRQSVCERHKTFRRAVDYCNGLSGPAPVWQVASAAGISQRQLERVFAKTLGISPIRYMQQQRLNAVHRALRAASRGSATVTKVAQHWGFTELGRFAGEYTRLFGESPSATLAATRRPPPKRLADTLVQRQ